MNARLRSMVRALWLATAVAGCSDPGERAPGDGAGAGGDGDGPTGECNNGVLEPLEICDGVELRGATCRSLGQNLVGGLLACNATCDSYDTSGCVPASCGDGRVEGSERCDGANLGGITCGDLGNFSSGLPTCNGTCDGFDTSGCTPALCGDARREGTEACDGTDLAGMSCGLLGFAAGGVLGCLADCSGYDLTGCGDQPGWCGDAVRAATESCDGAELAGQTCVALGHGDGVDDDLDLGGTLGCAADCRGLDAGTCDQPDAVCSGPDLYRPGGGINENLGDGEPCNFDSDCRNGCNSAHLCGDEGSVASVHAADLRLGEACNDDRECASGYCWQGGGTWICAEPCAAPVAGAAAGIGCRRLAEGTHRPPSGSACLPGPGLGDIGTPCVSGALECSTGFCFGEQFCSQLCSATSSCPPNSHCEEVTSNPYGSLAVCVADGRPQLAEGEACTAPFDCQPGLVCVQGEGCRSSCSLDSDCAVGQFCDFAHPAGGACRDELLRRAVGDACTRDSECAPGALCYGGPESICRERCSDNPCSDPLAICASLAVTKRVDTRLQLFAGVGDTIPLRQNDGRGPYDPFSRIVLDLDDQPRQFWIEVTQRSMQPLGAYSLEVTVEPSTGSVDTVVEDETATRNDSRADALPLVVPAWVEATFDGVPGVPDVDHFLVTVVGPGRLAIRTGPGHERLCVDAVAAGADGAACASGLACEHDCFPFRRSTGDSFCASSCDEAGDCGAGGVCARFGDLAAAGGICFPAGEEGLGTLTFGEPCAGDDDCRSLLCAKHPGDDLARCAAPCGEVAEQQPCGDGGICTVAVPSRGRICLPHLAGAVAPGGVCLWDADCAQGLVCGVGRCLPAQPVSRYQPARLAAAGMPCIGDVDCVSGLRCVGAVCKAPQGGGCIGDSPDGIHSIGETCDPLAVPRLTCADLGAGLASEAPACRLDCDAWDLEPCSGLPDGAACDGDPQCASGTCFIHHGAGFCATPCTIDADPVCTGDLFGAPVSCRSVADGNRFCLPGPGVGAFGEPCRDGYLDCASGFCFAAQFCAEPCSANSRMGCDRDETCVVAHHAAGPTSIAAPVCWPTAELRKNNLQSCRFDFECASGVCLEGSYCSTPCDNGTCEVGQSCGRDRSRGARFCFKQRHLGEPCRGLPAAVCPAELCVALTAERSVCADRCTESVVGSPCGNGAQSGGALPGECYRLAGELVCLATGREGRAFGDSCLLDRECSTTCCDRRTNTCGNPSSFSCNRHQ